MTGPLRLCDACGTAVPAGVLYCTACGASAPTEVGAGGAPEGAADEPAVRMAEVQAALGPGFEVRRLVGRGGFGEVWAAWDVQLHRSVAVKVLRPELVASAAFRERFQREARAVARLRHPHIVPVYFVGAANGLEYFIMPLVEGVTLAAALAREPRMPLAESVRILGEAAGALREAHARGIIHRDLKPENIMLEGPERRVLLMDFGIAQSPEALDRGLTGPGVVLGSPEFMSPEQATGARQLDLRSDIYSLGVVAYRMIAGRLPFDAPTARGMLIHHLTTEPEPLARVAEVPPAVSDAVMRCLAKDPLGRWQSSDEFLAALALAPGPDSPAPLGPAPPPPAAPPPAPAAEAPVPPIARRSWRRRPATIVLVSLLLVAVALAATALGRRALAMREQLRWVTAGSELVTLYRQSAVALDEIARGFTRGDSTGARALSAQEDLLAAVGAQADERFGAELDAIARWPDSLQAAVEAARRRMLMMGLAGSRAALVRSEVEGCRLAAAATGVTAEDAADRDNCWFPSALAPPASAPVEYFLDFRLRAPLRPDAGIGLAWCVRAADCRVIFLWSASTAVWGAHQPRTGLRALQSGARARLSDGPHALRVRLQDGILVVRLDERLLIERPGTREAEYLERPGSVHVIVQNAAATFGAAEPLGIVGMRRAP